MGETSISVSAETLARFNDLKAELNDLQADVPDHNADSFLRAMMDTWEQVGEIPEDGPEAITDALTDDEVAIVGTQTAVIHEIADRLSGANDADLADQLDRIERAATTAEERTGAIEKTLEEMGR